MLSVYLICTKNTFFYLNRKASLALIRKMIHFCSEALLKEVCDSDAGHNLPTVLVEITATVLDQEVSFFFCSLFVMEHLKIDISLCIVTICIKSGGALKQVIHKCSITSISRS